MFLITIYKILTGQKELSEMTEIVSWFSGGVTSAIACKLALDKFGSKCVIATIRLESEDEDNWRFLSDCENKLFDRRVIQLQHSEFKSPIEVFKKKRMFQMQGIGAPCTMVLKKSVRQAFEQDYKLFHQVFGYDLSEIKRAERFIEYQPEIELECPLIDQQITKQRCFDIIKQAGIEPPRTYEDFNNANCLRCGCVKGGLGYWNKFREVYPDRFEEMAALEEELHEYYRAKGLKSRPTVLRDTTLRDLDPSRGRHRAIYHEEEINCDFTCAFEIAAGQHGIMKNEVEQLALF